MSIQNPFDFFLEPEAETLPFEYDNELKKELEPYLEPEPAGPLLRAWLDRLPKPEGGTANFLVNLNQRLE